MEDSIIHCENYHILKTQGQPSPFQRSPRLHGYCLALRWFSWSIYVFFQARLLKHIGDANPFPETRLWLVLVAEVLLDVQQIILAVNALFPFLIVSDQKIRPRMELVGNVAPTVDVMITCCGEPSDVVLNTIRAAVAQDYPPDQFRVYVLDDGRDSELEKGIQKIQREVGTPKLKYLSRKSTLFFKAGNLQFGIEEAVKEGALDMFASLDADMVPHKQWLRRLIPHLLIDSGVGLACPPQAYYNTPTGDPLAQQTDLDMWFRHLEYLNDSVGAAMCTGSGFVARASALMSIGGWPLADAGEDFMCSSVLNAAGWKTIFVPEHDLQSGLCPNSLHAHISQRQRWVDSGLTVHKYFRYWTSKDRYANSTLPQRVVRILQLARDLSPLATLFSFVVLPLAVVSLHSVDITYSSRYGSAALYSFLVSTSLGILTDRVLYDHLGFRKFNLFLALDVWCAPYMTKRIIPYLIPKGFASWLNFEFRSSGSILSGLNERSRTHRASLGRRATSTTFVFHGILLIFVSMPALLILFTRTLHISAVLVTLPGPFLKLIDLVWKSSVPIIYLLHPPTVDEWEKLTSLEDWKPNGHGLLVRVPDGLKPNVHVEKYE